jgi:hypothetical protein
MSATGGAGKVRWEAYRWRAPTRRRAGFEHEALPLADRAHYLEALDHPVALAHHFFKVAVADPELALRVVQMHGAQKTRGR